MIQIGDLAEIISMVLLYVANKLSVPRCSMTALGREKTIIAMIAYAHLYVQFTCYSFSCISSSPLQGQVELFRWQGSHAGPPKESTGCTRGQQQAFCCRPPLSGGSAFLPVPLENLFPEAKNFASDFDPVFAEAFDMNQDQTPEPPAGEDPNRQSFAWIIMVGESADVQSFDKRDNSHLELFDCPHTHPDDYGVQKARAVCLSDSPENNCEDILIGGVEGTVVRLPPHCGPDTWVRAVSFEESLNQTLPAHLRRRATLTSKVYDFHYDYNFQRLRRDGGQVYVRIDVSNHPGKLHLFSQTPLYWFAYRAFRVLG